ncbi:MAG TPA: hemerythrin domain-containing protein [Actinomadura sp.]|jgi:hemerythrin superfamily protein|nr:hemerythrin domain-containing protein [Actinomadura sp.]
MTDRPDAKDDDVIELLVQQHQEIRILFERVQNSSGKERGDAFDQLRRLLAVHETAEEEVVHPNARQAVPDGDRIVDARLSEENTAKRLLADLERIGPEAPEFLPRFMELRQAVIQHAEHEEREEFPALRANTSEARLSIMATAVRAAEALAPTHPHPGVESTAANLLTGPFMAMVDRTRDVVRKAVKRT